MRRSYIPILIVAIFFFRDGNVYSQQHQAGIFQTIYFSPLPLKQYERIWKIEAELSCGHFSHFINTPEDWSLSIVRPINSVEKLEMEAGHGASQLFDIGALDGVIGIRHHESCFELKIFATIMTEVLDKRRVPIKDFKLTIMSPNK
jgi:hypothetical protein